MWEDFIYALQSFRRNKTRTFLSLLGVIIGVASVVIISSYGAASTKQVENTFGSAGLDVVQVSAGGFYRRSSGSSVSLTDSFAEELFDNIDNIKKIWKKNTLSATMAYGDSSSSVSCAAVETGYLEMYQKELKGEGSFFNVTDNVEGTQKVILSSETAEDFFPDGDAVGKMVNLVVDKVTFCFEVIGVLKESSSGMENSAAYIPRGFYEKKIVPNSVAGTFMIQATSNDKAPGLVTDIKNYITNITGNANSVRVSSMQSMLDQMSEITATMSMMLSAIAAISLLVGGIGIMNIMIVSVTERKQEIGIRKALGASPADICQQFLVESASITLLGGLIGVIVGILLSFVVEFVQKQAYVVNFNACVISFIFSVFVGIFFGLSPAIRASKLDPVIALSDN